MSGLTFVAGSPTMDSVGRKSWVATVVTLLVAARLGTACDSFGTTPASSAPEVDAGVLPEAGGADVEDVGTGCGAPSFLDEFERDPTALLGAWDRVSVDGPVGDALAIVPGAGLGGSAGLGLRVTPLDGGGDRTHVLAKDLPSVPCVVVGFSVRVEALRAPGAGGLTFAAIQESTRAPRYLLSIVGRSTLELAEQDIGGGGPYRPLASLPLEVGAWTRVVLAMDGSLVKVWFDGKPLAALQPALVHTPPRVLRFGLESAGSASEGAVTFDRVLVR